MIGFFWLTIMDSELLILKNINKINVCFGDPFISRLKANCIELKDFKLQMRLSVFYKSLKTSEPQRNSIFY